MRRWLSDLLCCPVCRADLALSIQGDVSDDGDILSGTLRCTGCARAYPIENGIPRFVQPEQNYSENFGVQWRWFRTVQVDRLAGHTLSATRFLKDTGWTPDWLRGKVILDAGAGAGRFSDVMAQLGARVVACDLSSAVDACRMNEYEATGKSAERGEIETVQGSLLELPFRPGVFDAVHCAGVIQHLPDPEAAMRSMPALVKPGGSIFYNFYEIDPTSKGQVVKYLLRRVTPNWSMPTLLCFSKWLCRVFFLPSFVMSRIPKVRYLNRFLPICSTHPLNVPRRQQYELTLLDTVDWYGPKYEIRQDYRRVADILRSLELDEVRSAVGWASAVRKATQTGQ